MEMQENKVLLGDLCLVIVASLRWEANLPDVP